MKTKYQGLVSISMIVLVIGAMIIYAVQASWQETANVRIHRIKPLPGITVPDAAVIKEIERLEIKMAGLVSPTPSALTAVNLKLFGYQQVEKTLMSVRRKPVASSVRLDYALTFVFVSDNKRFCIIDGSFYSEGSALPGGVKILKIEPKRVLIRKHRLSKWIPLAEKNTEGRSEKVTIGKNSKTL